MRPGDVIRQDGGLNIVVQAVHQGRPTEVLFQFPRPIEETDFRLLVWRAGHLAPLAAPRIGAGIRLGDHRAR